MARVKNKLVTKQMAWHANMTELNHLGASLHARPAQFEGKMAEIFSSKKYFSDNSKVLFICSVCGIRTHSFLKLPKKKYIAVISSQRTWCYTSPMPRTII